MRAGQADERFAGRMAERLVIDDARLAAEGRAALDRIRQLPRPAERRRSPASIAAAAALALGACSGPTQTQPMEAAPPPPYDEGQFAAPPPDAMAADAFVPPQPMEAAPPPPDNTQMMEAAPEPPPKPR